MSAVHVDLSISCRWILPMTSYGAMLENHTLLVRDGRILDVVPSLLVAGQYSAALHIDRSEHLLMPGLINAHIRPITGSDLVLDPQIVGDEALLCIAAMLRAGTTCFSSTGYFPDVVARMATAQGMRALIGMPIAEQPSSWAANSADYLTRALSFRDEFSGHPSVATAFAPLAPNTIRDSTFDRIAVLANELDAGVMLTLHESPAEVQACLVRHGMRPIERLRALGLLTPGLTATHMVHVNAADITAAAHGGIAIAFCAEESLRAGFGAPPWSAFTATDLRLSIGTGTAIGRQAAAADLWSEMRLLTLLARLNGGAEPRLTAWRALAMTTRSAAAALGLDASIGTLEVGKWADLCCIAQDGPALPGDGSPDASRLVFGGGRGAVSDVWVAGRHLLDRGAFTRLDWSSLITRLGAAPRAISGEST